jgi:hypothetical protein
MNATFFHSYNNNYSMSYKVQYSLSGQITTYSNLFSNIAYTCYNNTITTPSSQHYRHTIDVCSSISLLQHGRLFLDFTIMFYICISITITNVTNCFVITFRDVCSSISPLRDTTYNPLIGTQHTS